MDVGHRLWHVDPSAAHVVMPSQRELDQLHMRLAHEEQSLHALKKHAPMAPMHTVQSVQWRYLPQDGAPMQILVAPSLDGPKSHHVLHPGELFNVVDTATDQAGITFLKLQDGRGWALQAKPAGGSWLSFFGGAEKTVLCIPSSEPSGSPPEYSPGPPPGPFTPLTRPSVLSSVPPQLPRPQTHHMGMASPSGSPGGPGQNSDMIGLLGKTSPGRAGPLKSAPDIRAQPSSEGVQAAAAAAGMSVGSPASPSSTQPQLHVRVLSARGLRNMDIGSFFGNKSDPYVVLRLGSEQRQTPVIADNLDPVWTEGRDFTFALSDAPSLLEMEVFNSNMFVDDTLGKTSLSLSTVQPGQWVRKVDQLKGSSAVAPAEGELEYEVLVEVSKVQGGGGMQQGVMGVAVEQDLRPGPYKVMAGTAVYKNSTGCSDRDTVGHLAAGQQVSVQQVLPCPSEQRVRGLIHEPQGWIPLLDTSDGFRWALPVVTKTFLVDNTWLQASYGGLGYRFSKDLNDKDVRPGELGGAPWNSLVTGEDQGDGWLKVVDGRFLPMRVNGCPVLKVLDGTEPSGMDETAAAEEELDRLYRELNRRMDMSR